MTKVWNAVALASISFGLGASSCSILSSREPSLGREVARAASPDGRYVAVVLSDSYGGVTGDSVDEVYVLEANGGTFRRRLQVTFVNSLNDREDTTLQLNWTDERRLVVRYRNRHVTFFDNRAFVTEQLSDGVEVVLQRL